MAIEDWSEGIILVELPKGPGIRQELEAVADVVRQRADCEAVIDFSDVEILSSQTLASLLRLQKLVQDCGHRLVLCNVADATKGIFTVVGIDGLFVMHKDKFSALATVQTSV
jgi:anti-anti-sigma factor